MSCFSHVLKSAIVFEAQDANHLEISNWATICYPMNEFDFEHRDASKLRVYIYKKNVIICVQLPSFFTYWLMFLSFVFIIIVIPVNLKSKIWIVSKRKCQNFIRKPVFYVFYPFQSCLETCYVLNSRCFVTCTENGIQLFRVMCMLHCMVHHCIYTLILFCIFYSIVKFVTSKRSENVSNIDYYKKKTKLLNTDTIKKTILLNIDTMLIIKY